MTDYDRIRVEMVKAITNLLGRKERKSEATYKRELMITQAGDQFRKLVERGLDLPVVLLN